MIKQQMQHNPVFTGNIKDQLRVEIHPEFGRYVLDAANAAQIQFKAAVELALCMGATEILKAMRKIKGKSTYSGVCCTINDKRNNLAMMDSLMAVFGYHRVKRKGKNELDKVHHRIRPARRHAGPGRKRGLL